MATTIEVSVIGIVMFLSGASADMKPVDRIVAAAAIEDLGPRTGAYGVRIPRHEARLVIPKSDAVKILDVEKRVVVRTAKKTPQDPDTEFLVLPLAGDRVQFGEYNTVSQKCTAFVVGTDAPSPTPFQFGQPQPLMTDIAELTDPTLAPDAKPVSGKFTNVSPAKIAGWLDLHGGSLEPVPAHDAGMSDFRPGRVSSHLPDGVMWTFTGREGVDVCVAATPFSDKNQTVVFHLTQNTMIGLQNVPTGKMIDAHKGMSYDYELFYVALAAKPCLPPLPYRDLSGVVTLIPPEKDHHDMLFPIKGHPSNQDPLTGINCGPVGNSGPKGTS